MNKPIHYPKNYANNDFKQEKKKEYHNNEEEHKYEG